MTPDIRREGQSDRKWYRLRINCDCAAYEDARLRMPTRGFLRCRCCKRQLGPMQYKYLGTVRAKTEFEALKLEPTNAR